MKFMKKLGLGAMCLVLGAGLAACGDNGGLPMPKGNYAPTVDEKDFLDSLAINNKLLVNVVNKTSSQSPAARFSGDDWPDVDPETGEEVVPYCDVYQDYDNGLQVVNALKVPTSEAGYYVKLEWSVDGFYDGEPVKLPKAQYDDSEKLWGDVELTYPEWQDGVTVDNQPKVEFSLFARASFGTWVEEIEIPFVLINAMPTPKATLTEVYAEIAKDKGKSSATWEFDDKRFEVTGRIFNHYANFSDVDGKSESHVYAGVWIHDGERAIQLYSQNSSTGHRTVLADEFATQELKIGDVITVKGNLTYYQDGGNVQMNGISSLVKHDAGSAEEKAIPADYPGVVLTDELYASMAISSFGSDEWFDFTCAYGADPVVYRGLTYKSGTVKVGIGSSYHAEVTFTNDAGKDINLSINYHILTEAQTAIKNVLEGNVGAKFDLTGILTGYSSKATGPHIGAVDGNALKVHVPA